MHKLGNSSCRKYCRYESLSRYPYVIRHCSLTLCRVYLSLCDSTAHCMKLSFKFGNNADFRNVCYLTQHHSWWLAVYRACHCTLYRSQLVVGCIQGLSLYTLQVTVGGWLCTGPVTVNSTGHSWWLAVYRVLSLYILRVTVGGWLYTGPVTVHSTGCSWWLAVYRACYCTL